MEVYTVITSITDPTTTNHPARVSWRGRADPLSLMGVIHARLSDGRVTRPRGSHHGQPQLVLTLDVVDRHLLAVDHLATDQHPRETVADGGLHESAQRPGAVRRV